MGCIASAMQKLAECRICASLTTDLCSDLRSRDTMQQHAPVCQTLQSDCSLDHGHCAETYWESLWAVPAGGTVEAE